MRIDLDAFETYHELFLRHSKGESTIGADFEGFDHDFIQDEEIKYKRNAAEKGRVALHLDEWPKWKKDTGKILKSVQEACSYHVNLLGRGHVRYGPKQGAESPLYRVSSPTAIKRLEDQLYNFFCGGGKERDELRPRFEALCNYLRENRLGCKWPFPAYLAFLLDPNNYFPMIPTKFDGLIKAYGIHNNIIGNICWDNYLLMLEVSDDLKFLLKDKGYGIIDSIEVHSYMYVVSYLFKTVPEEEKEKTQDLKKKIREAIKRTERNERIGWYGEEIVVADERNKLTTYGLERYAMNVRRVSLDSDVYGYDVLSFNEKGKEIHIEVKTTTGDEGYDPGFLLSDNEREVAEKDESWKLVRVYDPINNPKIVDLGNVVRRIPTGWDKKVSTWSFRKI